MAEKNSGLHLTELILSIHNEVQSAIDYISEVAVHDGTELGKSTALMGVQTLRVKVPFNVSVEQKTTTFPKPLQLDRVGSIKSNLVSRKGFAIDVGDIQKKALFTKVKVLSLSKAPDAASGKSVDGGETQTMATGELEITFSPLKRD